MKDLILHGADLGADTVNSIARSAGGRVEKHRGWYKILGAADPDKAQLMQIAGDAGCDINILPAGFDPAQVRLLVTDMDSTLINIECVDEIADFAGLKAEVAAITEATMRGELDFAQSLTRRVALLAGLDQSVLQKVYDERLQLNPGAEAMIAGLKRKGIKVALVSGGFTFFTERLETRLGLDYVLANELEIEGGQLQGRVCNSIVGAERKREFLLELCRELNIEPRQAIAMGDGANDLLMMEAAGLGIAYHAKPKVQAQADCNLNHSGLEGVLALLGIGDEQF